MADAAKDFANFNYQKTLPDKAKIDQLCTGQFIQDRNNLILIGGTGTGKTHMATASFLLEGGTS